MGEDVARFDPTGGRLSPDAVQALAAQAAAGDREAFGRLCADYRADLLTYARRRLPQPEDAEDVLQLTFLKALRAIDRRNQSRPFNVWLFHIAANTIKDFYRTRKTNASLDFTPDPVEPSAEEQALADQVDARIEIAFAGLTARQRWITRLRVIDGLSYDEIAGRVGGTAAAARAAQMRALHALRAALDPAAAADAEERRTA